MRYCLKACCSLAAGAIASRAPITAQAQKSSIGCRRKSIYLSEPPLAGTLHELGKVFAGGISADIANHVRRRLVRHSIIEECFAFSSRETL